MKNRLNSHNIDISLDISLCFIRKNTWTHFILLTEVGFAR